LAQDGGTAYTQDHGLGMAKNGGDLIASWWDEGGGDNM